MIRCISLCEERFSYTILLSTGCGFCCGAELVRDSGRYQVILDRKPFGRELVIDDRSTESATDKVALPFWDLVALTRSESGVTRVGLVHSRDQRAVYVLEHDVFDVGLVVKQVDFDGDRVLLGNEQK